MKIEYDEVLGAVRGPEQVVLKFKNDIIAELFLAWWEDGGGGDQFIDFLEFSCEDE